MNTPYVFKVCSKCGELLPATTKYFHKTKSGKYGLRAICKKCRKHQNQENKERIQEYNKEYYKNNKEYFQEHNKEYRENHKDEAQKYNKEYHKKNRKKILEHKKKYYNENKELILKKQKQYEQENKEKIKEYQKEYRENNKEKIQNYKKEYYQTPRGRASSFNSSIKRRSKLETQGKGITGEQWLEMMYFFDWTCAYSGEKIKDGNSSNGRTKDHIIPLENGGLHEIWNVVPMKKGYNSSKQDRIDVMNWYREQEYFSEERLKRILEWQQYAYDKWASEDDDPLILIIDLYDNRKEVM